MRSHVKYEMSNNKDDSSIIFDELCKTVLIL